METKISASIPSDVEMPCEETQTKHRLGIHSQLLLSSQGLKSMISLLNKPLLIIIAIVIMTLWILLNWMSLGLRDHHILRTWE